MIFFFMYKKHELIIDFIFWNDIWYETFEKYSKQNLKLAESSKSLSPDKKKLKRSKLAEQPPIHTVLLIFPPPEK